MFRFLLLLILAYFVFRAARNLWRAIREEAPPQPLGSGRTWEQAAGPVEHTAWRDEVEEARYRDL